MDSKMNWKPWIQEVPDFPKSGVSFKDISPLLRSGHFPAVVREMRDLVEAPDYWVGIDSRGFIFASAFAIEGGGLILCRKKGKLPFSTYSKQYGLEYVVDEIEIHTDAFEPGSKVLLVDDVLATGGTLVAAIELVKQAGGIVTDIAVLSEITFLGGRSRIAEHSPEVSVHALISG